MSKKVNLPIVWDEKYEKMGVTPVELYMRQNGLCWLRAEVNSNNEVTVFCTDGKDKAQTDLMLNPTYECVKCMVGNYRKVIEDAISGKLQPSRDATDTDS